jgi:hypothetical protein
MKGFTVYTLLAVIALSQSPVLGTPKPNTKGTNVDAQDLNGPNEVAKREEASHAIEKRALSGCVSAAFHLLSNSFLGIKN